MEKEHSDMIRRQKILKKKYLKMVKDGDIEGATILRIKDLQQLIIESAELELKIESAKEGHLTQEDREEQGEDAGVEDTTIFQQSIQPTRRTEEEDFDEISELAILLELEEE